MEELNELKNLVMQNLEKNGYLSNIRAQIRSSVFKTIDSQEGSSKKVFVSSYRHHHFTLKIWRCRNYLRVHKVRMHFNWFRSFCNSTKWSIPKKSSILKPIWKDKSREKNSAETTMPSQPQMSQSFIVSLPTILLKLVNQFLPKRRRKILRSYPKCQSKWKRTKVKAK